MMNEKDLGLENQAVELTLEALESIWGGSIIEYRYADKTRYDVFDDRTHELIGKTSSKSAAVELAKLMNVSEETETVVINEQNNSGR